MTHRGRNLVFAFLVALLPSALQAQEVGLPVGTVGDSVTVETLDGDDFNIGQFLGKEPLLLQFWATWCEQCKALEPRMAQAHAQFGEQVKFLAVAVGVNQSPRSIRRHLERNPIAYDVVWDQRGRAVRAYRAPTTSYVVLFDANGVVTYTGVGPDQDIATALANVTTQAPSQNP